MFLLIERWVYLDTIYNYKLHICEICWIEFRYYNHYENDNYSLGICDKCHKYGFIYLVNYDD